MKSHPFLLSLLMVSSATLGVQAQNPIPPPQEAKAKSRAAAPDASHGKTAIVGVSYDGSALLTLGPGTLEAIAKQLEAIAPEMLNNSSESWAQMPNLVFGPGTQDAEVPTTMRLRQVTPVQALTLVAAAAGCALQPISAPLETGSSQAKAQAPASSPGGFPVSEEYKIIGYRFELLENPRPANRSVAMPVSGPLTIVTDHQQKSLPSASPSVAGVNPAGPFILEVAPVQKSTTPPAKTKAGNIFASEIEPAAPGTGAAAKADETSVRVYALGAFLRGAADEMKEKQVALQDLIESGLNLGSVTVTGKDAPNLSFHNGTKTLIVKATAAQHDIISQIVTALKENEAADSAGKR